MEELCSSSHTVTLQHVADKPTPSSSNETLDHAQPSTSHSTLVPCTSQSTPVAPPMKRRRITAPKSHYMETILEQMRASDESRVAAMNDMKQAIVDSNREKLAAIRELNETMKEVLKKL